MENYYYKGRRTHFGMKNSTEFSKKKEKTQKTKQKINVKIKPNIL